MKNSSKSGFSLVELLVAMAIIAVLIAIAAFGIGILQRNSRDTQRRKMVQDLVLVYNDVIANNGGRPTTLNVSTSGEVWLADTSSKLGTEGVPVQNSFTQPTLSTTGCLPSEMVIQTAKDGVVLGFDGDEKLICAQLEGSADGFSLGI